MASGTFLSQSPPTQFASFLPTSRRPTNMMSFYLFCGNIINKLTSCMLLNPRYHSCSYWPNDGFETYGIPYIELKNAVWIAPAICRSSAICLVLTALPECDHRHCCLNWSSTNCTPSSLNYGTTQQQKSTTEQSLCTTGAFNIYFSNHFPYYDHEQLCLIKYVLFNFIVQRFNTQTSKNILKM